MKEEPTMNKKAFRILFLFVIIPALCGCITISAEQYKGTMKFDTIQSGAAIDATARIQAKHTLAPEVVTIWKNWLNTDETIANWQKAIGELETEDMARSGLFTKIAGKDAADYDFLIKIDSAESKPSEHYLKVTMQAIDPRTNEALTTYNGESGLGSSMFSYSTNLKESLKRILADMRSKLLADYNEGKLRATAVSKKASRTTIQYLEQAAAAQKEGNYAGALTALRNAIRSNPQFPGSYRQASEFLMFLCDPDGAIRIAEESLKENPDDNGLRNVIGLAYNQKGDVSRAREYLGSVGFVGMALEVKDGKVNVRSVIANEGAQKAGIEPKRWIREFRVDDTSAFQPGTEVQANIFETGEVVDVTGVSKGKGTAGGMKRYGWGGGPASHGQSKWHRRPGSSGAHSYPGRVFKGHGNPGRMGNERVTIKNLKVAAIDAENNLILIRGAIPGARNGLVLVRKKH
jgi:50S ribosomal protein uL3